MKRYVCIYGHFHQPPRENPWLESVEREDSAHPYHDWNERVGAECYGPNAFSRILDEEGSIVDIVNNYAGINFSFNPLLLSWLESNMQEVYLRILEADRKKAKLSGGHGGAVAQTYGHIIMPLAKRYEKEAHIRWGIADFRHRFKRDPEGMWLPETAVDYETLEIMADEGILFTLLSPKQCAQVRKKGEEGWSDIHNGSIDSHRPYSIELAGEREIAVFFCDSDVSEELALGELLKDGKCFAERIAKTFSEGQDNPQVASVFSNGELYGHHQYKGDMALAYALHLFESGKNVRLGAYGEYLERFPPEYEVRIREKSSSSCIHGLERWKSDCGCSTGSHEGWHQRWRAPLRNIMDWLRDSLAELLQKSARVLLKDALKARDDYIMLLLERSSENIEKFFLKHAARKLLPRERAEVLELMEMQRNMLLMYSSSGWHSDDISGIESQQNMMYASRAMQLAKKRFSIDFEQVFSRLLSDAPSNVPLFGNGCSVYEELIKHAPVDNARFAGNMAVSLMYDEGQKKIQEYVYEAKVHEKKAGESGRFRYVYGIMDIVSIRTGESDIFRFAAVDLADQNIFAGVSKEEDCESFEAGHEVFYETFLNGDFSEITSLINTFEKSYSLKDLFRDIQRAVMQPLLFEQIKAPEAMYRLIYENSYGALKLMRDIRIPPPAILLQTSGYVLNRELMRLIGQKKIDAQKWEHIVAELDSWGIEIDVSALSFSATRRIEDSLAELKGDSAEWHLLSRLYTDLALFLKVPLRLNMYTIQNSYFCLAHDVYLQKKESFSKENEEKSWLFWFHKLQYQIGVKLP